jgi:EAL domain-containing protein (putative c-di-GMP-specific phosphodiesterase class I)
MGFHFQPVVRADRPDFPAFHEMLVRMRCPRARSVPAGAFMPAVEHGPLGRAIDRLALAEAVRLLEAMPTLRLSVNMSPLSMGDEGWLEIFERAAARSRPALSRLILEVTETEAIRDIGQTRDFMAARPRRGRRLRARRLRRGRHRLPPLPRPALRHGQDRRRLRRGGRGHPDAQVLVECLMAVARHFDMMTVAERVE